MPPARGLDVVLEGDERASIPQALPKALSPIVVAWHLDSHIAPCASVPDLACYIPVVEQAVQRLETDKNNRKSK